MPELGDFLLTWTERMWSQSQLAESNKTRFNSQELGAGSERIQA